MHWLIYHLVENETDLAQVQLYLSFFGQWLGVFWYLNYL